MIVNYTEAGWQIITQRAHGLLAAQICSHWKNDDQPERWIDILIATAEHDDFYNEFSKPDPLNANGGPLDYKTTSFKESDAQRLIEIAETKSAYIALLLSRHIQFVYGEDSKAKPFIRYLHQREKHWMKVADSNDAQVSRGYRLLEFCDAFSLMLCEGLIQPEERRIEISTGPDGKAQTHRITICKPNISLKINSYSLSSKND